MFKNLILGYVAKRLQEPSTWLGVVALLGAHFGLHFSPDFQGQLVQTLVDAGGLAAIAMKDPAHVWAVSAPVEQPVHPAGSMTTADLNQESAKLGA